MLQAIGVRAHLCRCRELQGAVNPMLQRNFSNHVITAIELPEGENDPRLVARVKAASGKTLLIFDPTDEATPVGLIRGELQGEYGTLPMEPIAKCCACPCFRRSPAPEPQRLGYVAPTAPSPVTSTCF